jgi:hypothetical protein
MLFLVLLAAVGVGAYATRAGGVRVRQSGPALIAAPDQWVFLSADLVTTSGPKSTTGRFYRNGAGSTRSEIPFPAGGVAITIHNLTTSMMYMRHPNGRWASAPNPSGVRVSQPLQYRQNLPNVKLLSTRIEGYEVYEETKRDQVRSVAPALNFLPLETRTPDRTEALKNIVLTEPAAELFEPPEGVEIKAFASAVDLAQALAGRK